ncbi:hypothetical protein NE237_027165 [Protea cynaroides]|uniref:Uncharacterized protein n=1 Tax=Protea cynaroides TaxID=273540 RepID=A0A9Q0GPL6_9MAGN|nr:hypothetical protein NE237_027165 [Protea cynaroides]
MYHRRFVILPPIGQRNISIAMQTTKEVVLKDYAMESEESLIYHAAYLMVASPVGSLAHVTCKEPLHGYISITKDAREAEIQGVTAEVPKIIRRFIKLRRGCCIGCASKVCRFLRVYRNASNNVHVGSHLAILVAIRDVCMLVVKELTGWVTYLHGLLSCLVNGVEYVNFPVQMMYTHYISQLQQTGLLKGYDMSAHCLSTEVHFMYPGILRVRLVPLHEFPEFLCDYHFYFYDVIPPPAASRFGMLSSVHSPAI